MLCLLLDDIRNGLEELFKDTFYESQGQERQKPAVHIGDLPAPGAPENFPYILVRIPEGESSEENGIRMHTPLIRIICGLWTEDGEEAQHMQISQIQYRIIQWLCTSWSIGGKWTMAKPLRWGFGVPGVTGGEYEAGAQEPGYSVGWIEARFQTRAEIDDYNPAFDHVYGAGQGANK